MTIKKFQGRTEEEATARAREEFGAQTVIMNVKEIKPKGILRSFKASTFEVTAAVEESEQPAAKVREHQYGGRRAHFHTKARAGKGNVCVGGKYMGILHAPESPGGEEKGKCAGE